MSLRGMSLLRCKGSFRRAPHMPPSKDHAAPRPPFRTTDGNPLADQP